MDNKETKGVITTTTVSDKVDTKTESLPKIQYPRIVEKIVYIRRKPASKLPFLIEGSLGKIGSAFSPRSQDVLRGLTPEEEERFLPRLIGTNTKSEHWDKATKEYWAGLSVSIPEGNGENDGLKLNISFKYDSKEQEEYNKTCTYQSGLKQGTPVNISDYILYRYCLVYNRVANTFEDINNSPKIEFYLFSKEEEISLKSNVFKTVKEANQLFYRQMSDRQWVDWVLRIFIASDKNTKIYSKDLDTISEEEKDIILGKYVQDQPSKFMEIANDKSLEIKAFIELCVASNKLTRIPNTETIVMGETPIGSTIGEAVIFLTNPKNANTYNTLKAQLNKTP